MAVILVMGASGGIGREVARQLSQEGATVILAARNQAPLEELQAEVGGEVCVVDATDIDAVYHVMKDIVSSYERLDGVVNCAGSLLLKPAHRTTSEEWTTVLTQNLTTAFAVTRGATAVMQKTGGSIVLCASAAAQMGLPNHEAIAAAKAGIVGLARSAAATYAAKGIRVNCVAPGLVETPLAEPILKSPMAREASLKMHPIGRLGQPDDVARVIAFLLRPENSWLTGQVIGIDGGLASIKGA